MVLNLCLASFLKNVTKTDAQAQKRIPDSIHQFPHYWHMHYILVDISDLLYQQKINLILFLGKLASHDSINPITKRHIIVLKNFDKVSFNMMTRFKNVSDGSGILILFVGKNVSCIDKGIISRCFSLRCVINVRDNHDSILRNLDIQLSSDVIDLYLDKSGGNMSKFLLLLENKKHNFIFEDFLKCRINKMVFATSNKDMLMCVNDTVSRIEISGVRPESVCRQLVHICASCFPTKNMHDIVALLAECQRKFVLCNKYSFLYEEMFIQLCFHVR